MGKLKTFSELVIENEFCDHGYADKMREQLPHCRREDIDNIKRKIEVMRNCIFGGKTGKAKVIFHEIAGLVNDSQMEIRREI